MSALDRTLDDLIKSNKKSGGGSGGRGRGRSSGPGPARRSNNRSSNRAAPYSSSKAPDSAWKHDMFSSDQAMANQGYGGGNRTSSIETGRKLYLKMIIQEVVRLYPGIGFTVRETLADVQISNKLCVPKGVNVWTWPASLHRDPQLWGPDALKFNPERFANGIPGACKIPQAYIPFGFGPRMCPGMKLGHDGA